MKKLENDILQDFLDKIIEELKNKNSCLEEGQTIDIPFIISSLYQNFKNHQECIEKFIEDLYIYPDYNIIILNSQDDENGIIDIEINLIKYKYINNDKYNFKEICPKYNYKLCFKYDIRNYRYCECTPDMPDYREDKHCCGHGCDAAFCEFSLYKISNIFSGSWEGDEHDYWEFEDEFYMDEKELTQQKEKEAREREIMELKNRIETDQKRLAELEMCK